jgi:hypothetical protein
MARDRQHGSAQECPHRGTDQGTNEAYHLHKRQVIDLTQDTNRVSELPELILTELDKLDESVLDSVREGEKARAKQAWALWKLLGKPTDETTDEVLDGSPLKKG